MMRPSWMVALCAVLLLCTGTFAHEIMLRDMTQEQERVTQLADMEGNGGIQGWVNMGKGFRELCTPGWPDVQALTSGGSDPQQLLLSVAQYLAGMLAVVGLCLIFALLSFCNLMCFYCCRRICGQAEPSRDYTKGDQYCAFATLGIAVILVVVGVSVGIASNALISQGVEDIVFSLNHTVSDIANLPDRALDTLGSVALNLNETVDSIVNELVAVPGSIGDDLDPLVAGVTSRMNTLQVGFDDLLQQATAIEDLVNGILAGVATINSKVDAINVKINDLSNSHSDTNPAPYSWSMDPACLPADMPIAYDLDGLLPSFEGVIADVASNNLSVIANDIQNQYDSISANTSSMIQDQLSSVTDQIYAAVGSVSTMANDVVDQQVGPIVVTVEDVRNTFLQIYEEYVVTYNGHRNSGMIAFFAASFVVVLFVILGFVFHQSMLFSCGGNLAWLFMIFLWLLCALHFFVAAVLGKGCELLVTLDLASVYPPIAENPYYETAMQVYEECQKVDGNVAEFFNLTQQFDIDSYVDQYLNASALTGALDSFDISNALSALDVLDSIDIGELSVYLGQINADYGVYAKLMESVLVTKATQTNTNVTIALNDAKADAGCWSVTGDSNAAMTSYEAAVDDITADISALNSGDLIDLQQNLTQLQTLLDNFSASANTSLPTAQDLVTYLLSLDTELVALTESILDSIVNVTLPSVLAQVRGFVNETTDEVISLADCYWMAQDINATRNSLCVVLLGGFDGVYWAAGGLATFLFVTLIGIVLTAKRWALNYDQALAGKVPTWLGGSKYDDANVHEYEMSDKYDTTRKDQYY